MNNPVLRTVSKTHNGSRPFTGETLEQSFNKRRIINALDGTTDGTLSISPDLHNSDLQGDLKNPQIKHFIHSNFQFCDFYFTMWKYILQLVPPIHN